jgi:hypothetical protein
VIRDIAAAWLRRWTDWLDRRAWQASTSTHDHDVTAVQQSWQWDDEPRRIDTLAIWSAADQNSIDAAFLVIADAAESAEFAAIIRRHAKGRQSQ